MSPLAHGTGPLMRPHTSYRCWCRPIMCGNMANEGSLPEPASVERSSPVCATDEARVGMLSSVGHIYTGDVCSVVGCVHLLHEIVFFHPSGYCTY